MSSATKNVKGLLGTKLGMTQVWDENNKLVPVTVIEIAPNVVTQVRTPEKDGYEAVQIAAGAIDPRKVNQPAAGHFREARRHPAPPPRRGAHRRRRELRARPGAHGRRAPSKPASSSTSSARARARASPVS